MAAMLKTKAYPVTIQLRRQSGHKSHRSVLEATVFQNTGNEIEDVLKALVGIGCFRGLCPAEHDLEPGNSPVKLPHHGLNVIARTPFDLQNHNSMDLARNFNGIG